MKHEYRIYKRNDKKVWYFYYYEGTKRICKSTGKSKKHDADLFVKEYLRIDRHSQEITFEEYAANFYNWEKCEWIKRQHAKGKSFSRGSARNYRALLLNHIFPAFGGQVLKTINPVQIENWLVGLKLAGQTKNHILQTFSTIFKEALRERLIDYNPILSIEPMALNREPRTSLTFDEIKTLFPKDEEKLLGIWKNWFKCTIFYLMLTTGLRSGEVRALKWSDISFGDKAVMIQRAVKSDNLIGTTKAGYGRAAFLPERTIEFLNRFRAQSPFNLDDDFIFFGRYPGEPCSKQVILKYFNEGLEQAGIDKKVRKLNVHCVRHTYNTMMRAVLSEGMLRVSDRPPEFQDDGNRMLTCREVHGCTRAARSLRPCHSP